jgi:hypothetical protein
MSTNSAGLLEMVEIDDKALSICRQVAWLDHEASGDFASLDGIRGHLSAIAVKARAVIEANRVARGSVDH